jgi:N-acetylmuramoyl-L-alanine amidase
MTPEELQGWWELALLSLALWREAQNQPYNTKLVVACSMRNRVGHPCWWGGDWDTVLTKRDQYSSMTSKGDPNLIKWPQPPAGDPAWLQCMRAAAAVHGGAGVGMIPDQSMGATHYFDRSLDADPPSWAKDGSMVKVLDSGSFHFYRQAGTAKAA